MTQDAASRAAEKRKALLWASLVFRALGVIYLLALLAGMLWGLYWLTAMHKVRLNLPLALAANVIGIALVIACPFCRLSDYFKTKADKS